MLRTDLERASPEFRGEVCAGGVSLGTANAYAVFKAMNYEKSKQGGARAECWGWPTFRGWRAAEG